MGSSTTLMIAFGTTSSCNNPSKWGLQQLNDVIPGMIAVVITPQNGVFNNKQLFVEFFGML